MPGLGVFGTGRVEAGQEDQIKIGCGNPIRLEFADAAAFKNGFDDVVHGGVPFFSLTGWTGKQDSSILTPSYPLFSIV
jgi:hypothetical protein